MINVPLPGRKSSKLQAVITIVDTSGKKRNPGSSFSQTVKKGLAYIPETMAVKNIMDC